MLEDGFLVSGKSLSGMTVTKNCFSLHMAILDAKEMDRENHSEISIHSPNKDAIWKMIDHQVQKQENVQEIVLDELTE